MKPRKYSELTDYEKGVADVYHSVKLELNSLSEDKHNTREYLNGAGWAFARTEILCQAVLCVRNKREIIFDEVEDDGTS